MAVLFAVTFSACAGEHGIEDPADELPGRSQGDDVDHVSEDTDGGQAVEPDAGQPVEQKDAGNAQVQEDAGNVAHEDAATAAPDSGSVVVPDAPPTCQTLFYLDADKDGFGDPSQSVRSCSVPTGYVANDDDCYDGSDKARPDQTGRFSVHRGDGSYDYDCDGGAIPRLTRIAVCGEMDNACPPPSKWPATFRCDYETMANAAAELGDGWTTADPGCGNVGQWGVALFWSVETSTYSCSKSDADTQLRRQTCR